MLLGSVFDRFVQQKPFCVMARASLQRILAASSLDALFRSHATVQYQRELLFSQLTEVIARVVTRADRSV
jgi:hypothetical protein